MIFRILNWFKRKKNGKERKRARYCVAGPWASAQLTAQPAHTTTKNFFEAGKKDFSRWASQSPRPKGHGK
jgi:hypothetical protein